MIVRQFKSFSISFQSLLLRALSENKISIELVVTSVFVLQIISANLGIKIGFSGSNLSDEGDGEVDGTITGIEVRDSDDNSKILDVQLPQATDVGELQDLADTARENNFDRDDVAAFMSFLMPFWSFFDYTGSKKADVAEGFATDDEINLRGGNDRFIVGEGNDNVNAAGGKGDVVDLRYTADLGLSTFDLSKTSVTFNSNTFSYQNFEDAYGNAANNRLFGDDGDNTLKGMAGNDFMNGRNGVDDLMGGKGADTVRGGAGNDNLWGQQGNDSLVGGRGFDWIFGGGGNDRALGGKGKDMIKGQAGSDRLFGQNGADQIWGGSGADFINGGLGNDTMTGGGGRDRFIFNQIETNGRDVITDFQDGLDKISLNIGIGFDDLNIRSFNKRAVIGLPDADDVDGGIVSTIIVQGTGIIIGANDFTF